MAQGQADILVIGAGPAGAVIAHALASKGFDVAMATRLGPGGLRAPEVLAPNCAPMLAALDLVQVLERSPAIARPCWGVVRRWGDDHASIGDYLAEPGGRGFVVDRAGFDALLERRAMDAGAHRMVVNGSLALSHEKDGWHVHAGADALTGRFIVDATGRAAAIARRLGVRRERASRLVAFGHRTTDAHAAPGWLSVEGVRDGWRYRVRGCDGRTEAVLVTTPEGQRRARRGGNLHEPRFATDASSMALERCAGTGWLAVGDAAASFDPIASQGLANAMSSALAGADAICEFLEHGRDEGLASYDAMVRRTWRHAVAGTRDVYDAERRWPDAPFWRTVRGHSRTPRRHVTP